MGFVLGQAGEGEKRGEDYAAACANERADGGGEEAVRQVAHGMGGTRGGRLDGQVENTAEERAVDSAGAAQRS